MAGEEHRDAVGGPVGQDLGQRVDPDRVEARERLVEDQDLGVVDQGGGQLHPLLVAERQLLDPVAGAVGHAQPLDPVAGGARRVLGREPVQPGEVHELVADPHLGVQAALLGHVAEAAAVSASTGRPRQRTSPPSGSSTPSTIRMAVVFPAPFGPTNPNIWPARTVNDRSSRATTSP